MHGQTHDDREDASIAQAMFSIAEYQIWGHLFVELLINTQSKRVLGTLRHLCQPDLGTFTEINPI